MQLSHLAVLSITTLIPLISASLLPETVNLALSSPLSKRGPGGWNKVTYPKGSAEDNIPVQDGTLQLFAMTKKGQDKTLLKRVIFVIHGEGRDPWNYYSHMTQALANAYKTGVVANINEIGIWAPGFWCQADQGVWPASEKQQKRSSSSSNPTYNNQLVWNNDDWAAGSNSIYPANSPSISSFTAIDDAIIYFSNKTVFPNVETIVIAGHSEGGQMIHRYAQLSNHPVVEPEVHYWIGNPASWLYLDDRRPQKGIGGARSSTKCPLYNDYKYGLNNIDTLLTYNSPYPSKEVIYQNYKNQFVHYALGLQDLASASTNCAAFVQGNSHLNRGRIYQAYLELMEYPDLHTIDYVAGVGHNDYQMFSSKRGMFRLFIENNSQGKTMASSKDKTAGLNVKFTAESPAAEQNMPGQI